MRVSKYNFGMIEKIENLSQSKISLADIRQGMTVIARIIRLHGDSYWPIMERLQRELSALEGREKLLSDLLENDGVGRQITPDEASFG